MTDKISCWVCHGQGFGGWNGANEECDPCNGTGKVPNTPAYEDPETKRRRANAARRDAAEAEEEARLAAVPTPDPEDLVRDRYNDRASTWNNRDRFVADLSSLGEKVYAVDVEFTCTTRVIVGADGPNHAAEKAIRQIDHGFRASANHSALLGDLGGSSCGQVGSAEEVDPVTYVDRFGRPVAVDFEVDHDRHVATIIYGNGSRRLYALDGYVGPIASFEDGWGNDPEADCR